MKTSVCKKTRKALQGEGFLWSSASQGAEVSGLPRSLDSGRSYQIVRPLRARTAEVFIPVFTLTQYLTSCRHAMSITNRYGSSLLCTVFQYTLNIPSNNALPRDAGRRLGLNSRDPRRAGRGRSAALSLRPSPRTRWSSAWESRPLTAPSWKVLCPKAGLPPGPSAG